MSAKRRHDSGASSSPEEDSALQSSKRPRMQAANKQQREAATDATYGQRCVFSSLGDSTVPSDDDLEFEDEGEALAYLRSVRQEASGIPHVIVAPKAGPQLPPQASELYCDGEDGEPMGRSMYTNGIGDARGYYQDGAYTAAPDQDEENREDSEAEEGEVVDGPGGGERLRQTYYSSLVDRFVALRRQLHQEPPAEAVASLPEQQAWVVQSVGPRSKAAKLWRNRLGWTDPWPAQVAAMDKVAVLRLLRVVLNNKLLKHGYEISERTSRWLWSLLARLPDSGELDYAEVGVIRDLGKRAVLMMTSMAEVAALRKQAELDEGDGPEEEDDDEEPPALDDEGNGAEEEEGECPAGRDSTGAVEEADGAAGAGAADTADEPAPQDQGGEAALEAARARLLSSLNEMEAEASAAPEPAAGVPPHDAGRAAMNQRATLCMILTVAGEFYGQRDLLGFRDPFGDL